MRAVILAAGAGRRLRAVAGAAPKCLVPIGGMPLLEWQLQALEMCGAEEITVVVGYQAEAIQAVCGARADFVYNPDFASTNSLYSLWLARHLLGNGCVILNSDVLFHPELLARLLEAPHEDALLLARRTPEVRYSDEEMKVQTRGGRVLAIAKDLPDERTDGENVGIVKFGAAGAAALVVEADALVADGGRRDWLPRAFDRLCRRRPLHVVDTASLPWIEIDFPDDYARACRDVLPAIIAPVSTPARAPRVSSDTVATASGRMFHRV